MGAIIGRVEFDQRPVNKGHFRSSMAAIAHYGGDGNGTWIGGSAALGYHHLNVARRNSEEQQPLQLGCLVIVADAILDNRIDLANNLHINPSEADTLPDSALIVRAYRKWGEGCVQYLIGDFAFAIYDTEKRRLFLARDHIGARPLYWFRRGDTVLFATDIRGLVAFLDIDWRINEITVANYLNNPSLPLKQGFFEGIKGLEPGHRLKFDRDNNEIQRWWDPHQLRKIHYKKNDDYVAHLRELTELAVSDRINSSGNIGSHISGGLDSSAITILAQRFLQRGGRSLKAAYTWAPPISKTYPDMGRQDERRLIQKICCRESINCRYGSADGDALNSFLNREIELDGASDLIDEIPVIRKATEDGIRVMLSGWGGDEAFSTVGSGYLSEQLKRGRFLKALRIAHQMTGRRKPSILGKVIWTSGIVPMLPDYAYYKYSSFHSMYKNDCFASEPLKNLILRASKFRSPDIRLISDPGIYMENLIQLGHVGARMSTWAAWSSRGGFVYRYPLTDRRILEFLLSLPHDVLFQNGKSRYLARSSLIDILPEYQGKYDVANECLRKASRLFCWKNLAKKLAEGAIDANCDWLEMAALRRTIKNVPIKIEHSEQRTFAEVSAAVCIWHLYRRYESPTDWANQNIGPD